MAEMLEIRWHGRGGQGAKTAAILLAEAAAAAGKYIQAFPEYGPERMGAPVVSYNRISDEPILLHSSVVSPQYVMVLDSTFIGSVDFTAGIPPGGTIVLNTSHSRDEMWERMQLGDRDLRLFVVDASAISEAEIGRPIPNTPMLGALAKVSKGLELEALIEDITGKLERKFRDRPEVIEGNLRAIRRAHAEVSGG
ncbi:MAG: pyruvate synthase [Firmicutes bacterium]|nr:pyruvate synthase [Bacillota bacterium]